MAAPAPMIMKKPPPPAHLMRPGDWLCEKCGEHNFANKLACFSCRAAAPAASNRVATPMPADVRPGDWMCTSCGTHNFANKVQCFRCKSPSPAMLSAIAGGAAAPSVAMLGQAQSSIDLRPGDWICNGCGCHNFANKTHCFKCSGMKPVDPSAAAAGMTGGNPSLVMGSLAAHTIPEVSALEMQISRMQKALAEK